MLGIFGSAERRKPKPFASQPVCPHVWKISFERCLIEMMLPGTSASLLVTSALLVVTISY